MLKLRCLNLLFAYLNDEYLDLDLSNLSKNRYFL